MSSDIRSVDYERGFLSDLLGVLEAQMVDCAKAAVTIEVALDDFAFTTGLAFVACQRYITSTCGWLRVSKRTALGTGPRLNADLTYVEALNAAADYWKHADAWNDPAEAKRSGNTKRVLTLMGLKPDDVYTGQDLFGKFDVGDIREFLPILEKWRADLWRGVQLAEKSAVNPGTGSQTRS